jgi:hypothetical protein
VSSITGVNKELTNRFNIVLQAMSSWYGINIAAFHRHATEALLFVALMPAFVNKMSIHGRK